ncbi:MAG: hypothetical protein QOI15_241, partial [Pseudonocardiales bacterium]|nr:hypothetical protein [Pseudonocardiales bacterium]
MVRDGLDSVRRGRRTLSRGTTWWREVLLIGVLYGAYELSRGLGDANVRTAIANGQDILHFERMWHMAPERVLNEAIEQITWIAVAASYFYSLMHYVVTPVVLVWMYRKHSEHYGRARTALAMSTALGLIGYLLLPTAPPRFVPGFVDVLHRYAAHGWWSADASAPRGLGGLTNELAAFPSLHAGWALWVALVVHRYAGRTWLRAAGWTYALATVLALVAYLLLPTAPPRFVPGFVDVLHPYAAHGWWSADASAPRGLG